MTRTPRQARRRQTARQSQTRRASGFAARGFSLLEVIVAISLILVLGAVVSVNMFGDVHKRYLDEGSQQFETALRMARADASNQGRRLRFVWNGSEERIVVMWEPQPLAQPGQFVEYTASSWTSYLPNTTVRIANCRRLGDADVDALVFGKEKSKSDKDAESTTLIDFYPDGSCDSAVFELSSRHEDDERRAVVEMDGLNYLISTRIMTASEFAEWTAQTAVSNTDSDY